MSSISRASGRHPLPLTVTEPPAPAWDLDSFTLGPAAADAGPAEVITANGPRRRTRTAPSAAVRIVPPRTLT
ncbi:hypothetical protein, partial [Streptomyces anthocyanicus]|uniref:hypothetical protein n=1 Tax=Streptomyces anthocyanicus TaxID=68174 RepID=UPI003669EE4F